ncbi:hypothetical protein ISR94_01595 [Candidatus Microgenomates bacterium]|nr:hypothetical protein [Candidatus Microgenomates bacterium]
MNKRLKYLLIWATFLFAGPIAVYLNTDMQVIGTNRILITNLIQRYLGTAIFGMLAFQIVFREKISITAHKLSGALIYSLVLLHPALWIVQNYFLRGSVDIYYPFIDICGLCKGPGEYFYNSGRLAFWSITLAVGAAVLVRIIKDKWLSKNWKNFHVLNYFAFYFVSIHAIGIGSDITHPLFIILFVISHILVGMTIKRRLKLVGLKSKLKKLLSL